MGFLNVVIVFLTIVTVGLETVTGCCDPLKFKPSISVKQEYNDNILFERDFQEHDFITTISPDFMIEQKGEQVQASVIAGIDKVLYWNFSNLNALDMDLKASARVQVTERLGFGVSGGYSEDSRRDRETDFTGLVLAGDRERTTLSLFSDYAVSELTRATLDLSYSHDTIVSPDDERSQLFRVEFAFARNLSKWFDNTTGLLNLSYMNYSSDDRDLRIDTPLTGLVTSTFQEYTFDLWQVYSGISKKLTEPLSVYAQAGLGYTRSDEKVRRRTFLSITGVDSVTPANQSSTGSSFNGVFAAGLDYNGLYHTAGISIYHDARGSSGLNGSVERTSVTADFSRKINSELTANLSCVCYLNQTDKTLGTDYDELTISARAGMRYRLSQDYLLSFYYQFRTLEDRERNSERNQNLVYFTIQKTLEI